MDHPIFLDQICDLLIGSLCVWRFTHLLASEQGPFALAARLRAIAGDGLLGQALDCFYCLSLWLAAPPALLLGAGWLQRLLLWPAFSGAACLLERATQPPEFPAAIYEEPKEQ